MLLCLIILFSIGKKCTYGHKCKYYHPERGSQPQRSVADELRAMSRNTAAKTTNEGGLVKSNSVPCSTKADSTSDVKRGAPKRQSDPSIRTQVYQDLEEKLPTKNKLETRSVPSLVSIPATSTAKPQSTTPLSNGLPSGALFCSLFGIFLCLSYFDCLPVFISMY